MIYQLIRPQVLTKIFFCLSLISCFSCAHLQAERNVAATELTTSPGPQAAPGILEAWTEMGPGGQGLVRVVTSASKCPEATVGAKKIWLKERATPTADGHFSQLVCELEIPIGVTVVVEGKRLPIIPASPKKILVIGDTGCLIKDNPKKPGKVSSQNCNNMESGWPFAEIVKVAAATKPDLVIHVGDYHYREAACPPGSAKCANSFFGDNWDSWNEDFFAPVQPLLQTAPFVFVRGNHENCARAQEGFFRMLDPRPLLGSCVDASDPYTVIFKNLSLAVMDSSFQDITADDLAPIGRLPVSGAWLVTHRPPWITEAAKSVTDSDGDSEPDENEKVSAGEAAESTGQSVGVPHNLGLVIAGHRHIFRAMSFTDHRPPEIITGNSGTLIEKNPAVETPGSAIDGGNTQTSLKAVNTFQDFGYMVIQQTGHDTWLATEYDRNGQAQIKCPMVKKHDRTGLITLQCSGVGHLM